MQFTENVKVLVKLTTPITLPIIFLSKLSIICRLISLAHLLPLNCTINSLLENVILSHVFFIQILFLLLLLLHFVLLPALKYLTCLPFNGMQTRVFFLPFSFIAGYYNILFILRKRIHDKPRIFVSSQPI